MASRYLTVLPLGPADGGPPGGGAPWFPVVGLLLGTVLAGTTLVLDALAPVPLGAVLVTALWAAVTGGLHLDGLADTLDGLGGGWSRDEALRIMRDSRVGAFGVVGVVLVLLLKAAAVATLPPRLRWRGLLVAPPLARASLPVLGWYCPPARPDGAGHAFAGELTARGVLVAAGLGLGVSLALLGPWGLVVAGAALGEALALSAYLRRRLGGFTGDSLGALVEGSEAGSLTLLAVLAHLGLR